MITNRRPQKSLIVKTVKTVLRFMIWSSIAEVLRARLKRGWTIEEALTTPLGQKRKNKGQNEQLKIDITGES